MLPQIFLLTSMPCVFGMVAPPLCWSTVVLVLGGLEW